MQGGRGGPPRESGERTFLPDLMLELGCSQYPFSHRACFACTTPIPRSAFLQTAVVFLHPIHSEHQMGRWVGSELRFLPSDWLAGHPGQSPSPEARLPVRRGIYSCLLWRVV